MCSHSIHPYAALARTTVANDLAGVPPIASGREIDPRPGLWDIHRACFVSIKRTNGDLRGCIGTISPAHPSLDLEIISNAISAARRDPRFPPMRTEEMPDVLFSVDVLSAPERVADIQDLDPKKWGVIVSRGFQRGVLLPDLDGVDTVEAQLGIAAQKAGLSSLSGAMIERFIVERYPEDPRER